jgi:hypothetical protein
VNRILDNLKQRTLPVSAEVNGTYQNYGLVDYKMARSVVFVMLYSPYGSNGVHLAPSVTYALAQAEKGNGLPLGELAGLVPTPFRCECPSDNPPTQPLIFTPDTTYAIACGDGAVLNDTVEDLEKYFEKMSKDSEFADMWSIRSQCT